ncbi:MAG: hypothetical protein MK132_07485 [Lentisphaerales bacterium]|nr:hypothetical protein [Lentisphaerales bacterium]
MIKSVEQIAEVLGNNGYETQINENAVFTKIGGSSQPYTAVLELSETQLTISCELAKLGDFEEDRVPELFAAALSANTVIDPFAFAIIDEADDDSITSPEEYSFILIDTVPVGDLSEEELSYSMDSLWKALTESASVLRTAFAPATV